ATQFLVALPPSPAFASPVARFNVTPSTTTDVEAPTTVVPTVVETSVTMQVPVPPEVVHWPFAGVNVPGPLTFEKVTTVPSGAATYPPVPVFTFTVAVNVCVAPSGFVADAGVMLMLASTHVLVAFGPSPACASPVARLSVTPATTTEVEAESVVTP